MRHRNVNKPLTKHVTKVRNDLRILGKLLLQHTARCLESREVEGRDRLGGGLCPPELAPID